MTERCRAKLQTKNAEAPARCSRRAKHKGLCVQHARVEADQRAANKPDPYLAYLLDRVEKT